MFSLRDMPSLQKRPRVTHRSLRIALNQISVCDRQAIEVPFKNRSQRSEHQPAAHPDRQAEHPRNRETSEPSVEPEHESRKPRIRMVHIEHQIGKQCRAALAIKEYRLVK